MRWRRLIARRVAAGPTVVPLADMAPSRLVAAWNKADANLLVRSLAQVAAAVYRSRSA